MKTFKPCSVVVHLHGVDAAVLASCVGLDLAMWRLSESRNERRIYRARTTDSIRRLRLSLKAVRSC